MTSSTTRPSAPPAPDVWALMDLYWAIGRLLIEAHLQLPAAIAAEGARLANVRRSS